MTCGGIIILAECAQAGGSKHFNQSQLDATWENTTVLLRLIGRENARARGYLEHLLLLKEQARSAYFCTSTQFYVAFITHHLTLAAMRNSVVPSRVPSRRPSVSHEGRPGGNTDEIPLSVAEGQTEEVNFMASLFQDNWDWSLDGGMPTYGGLGFGDEFIFPLSSWPA
jgi:hypothetical protein